MINMTCLLYKASGQTNLIFLSCRFHMSNFIIVIKMNEDMNLFGLYNINPCNMIGRFSVRIARFIRSKILLLFVCVFMLPAIQRCVSPGHDLEPGQELSGEDWPQWRGPSSNGVSSEANLPARWSTDSNIVWKVALAGLGGSSPIVLGNRVFVTSQVGTATIRGGSHPQLARDDPSLVVQENPMGGRRSEPGEDDSEVLLVVEASIYQTEKSSGIIGLGRQDLCLNFTNITTLPRQHRSAMVNTYTPCLETGSLFAWIWMAIWYGRAIWGGNIPRLISSGVTEAHPSFTTIRLFSSVIMNGLHIFLHSTR